MYLAHDLKHDRDVAITVLTPELAASLPPRQAPPYSGMKVPTTAKITKRLPSTIVTMLVLLYVSFSSLSPSAT